MHSTAAAGANWPRLLNIKADIRPMKKPHVAQRGRLLTWFRKAGMTDSVKAERELLLQLEGKSQDMVRTRSSGWKIKEEVLRSMCPTATAKSSEKMWRTWVGKPGGLQVDLAAWQESEIALNRGSG